MNEEMGSERPADVLKIDYFEGIGELTVGVGGQLPTIVTALCLLDHPVVNKYFLAQKLKLSDRTTKTQIFPRPGMALPDGEVYQEPEVESE
jgi:hypothetical protein